MCPTTGLRPAAYEIARTKLAVDGEIEAGLLTERPADFKANADRPDIFRLKWPLLTDKDALVPRMPGTHYDGFHDEVSATPPAATSLIDG
ncbi:hypothetical protein [Rhizobium sp. 3T7]|uniref:hypothetical protein n=1 Tax=Rhizobium sp. 3T7 TaxID=2874922 RepID=UPI0029622923|nr:hypothetical protein [Rhizobium sp. 3T7]